MARPDEAKGDEGIGAALARFSEVAAVAAVAAPAERRYSAREVAWVLGVAAVLLGLLDIDGLLTWARRMEVGPVRSAWLVALTPVRGGLDAVGVTRPRAALHDAADWVTTRVGTSEDPLVAQGWRAGAERAAGHRATRGGRGTAELEPDDEPTGSAEEDDLPVTRGRERKSAGPLDAEGRTAAEHEDGEDRAAAEASGAAVGRPGAVGGLRAPRRVRCHDPPAGQAQRSTNPHRLDLPAQCRIHSPQRRQGRLTSRLDPPTSQAPTDPPTPQLKARPSTNPDRPEPPAQWRMRSPRPRLRSRRLRRRP